MMKYPYGMGSVKWISTEWLEEHLDDEELLILDVQPDIHDYILGHIPGAVHISEVFLRLPFRGLPGRYAPLDAAQSILRCLGIKPGMPVVVYTGTGAFKGRGDGLEQMVAAYSLARFGHENVYVLDGGFDKWKEEKRSLTKEIPTVEESDFRAQVMRDCFLEHEELKAIKDREDVILLDSRPPALYDGQGPNIKPGHIPGALNLPWQSLMDKKNRCLLRPSAEMQAILDAAGIIPEKTIICSCGTGRGAACLFLILRYYLGYPDVRIYEGSFLEWCSHPENPTVTGKSPW